MTRFEEKARKIAYLSELVGQSATTPLAGVSQAPTLARSHELGVTFIGHSSFLIQIAGQTVLVDPVFAKWLIVLRRLRHPGVRIDGLPAIDAVLLTHAHMDHLNRPSLRKIVAHTRRMTGKAPVAIVPWGVENLIQDLGFSKIVSLEWWQKTELGAVDITLTPAKHWGARLFNDTYRGFGGYVLRGTETTRSITPAIRLISQGLRRSAGGWRRRLHCCRSAPTVRTTFARCIPVPKDALQGFLDLRARWMVPMHFGTFRLSAEPVDRTAATAAGGGARRWSRRAHSAL